MRLLLSLYFFLQILLLLRILSAGYLCWVVKLYYYAEQIIRQTGVCCKVQVAPLKPETSPPRVTSLYETGFNITVLSASFLS